MKKRRFRPGSCGASLLAAFIEAVNELLAFGCHVRRLEGAAPPAQPC
jgi:hypothetical protein